MKRTTWLATIPLAAVVALEFSLLPALAGASGVHLRPYAVSYPGTGFGGYQVGANAREIAATITVPTIATTSPVGDASTWIAVEGSHNHFLQVGIAEFGGRHHASAYQVFWSDPPKNFFPVNLGRVKAADVLTLSMKLGPKRWNLVVRDVTQQKTFRAHLRYGVHLSFSQGEWLQEDPTPAELSTTDLPYPVMSKTRFLT